MIRYILPIVVLVLVACSGADDDVAAGMRRVDAPIESIEIHKIAAKPPNATMIVVTGLRNGCEKFDRYSLRRTDDLFSLSVINLTNDDPGVACTDDYRTVTTDIPLEGPIEECKPYVVEVNGEPQTVILSYTPFMGSDSRICDQ